MWLCRFASESEPQTWHVFFPFSHWEKDSRKQNPIHPLLTNLTSSPAESKCAIASTCPTLRSLFVHRGRRRFLLFSYDICYETPTTLSPEEDESLSNRNQLVFLALRSGSEFFCICCYVLDNAPSNISYNRALATNDELILSARVAVTKISNSTARLQRTSTSLSLRVSKFGNDTHDKFALSCTHKRISSSRSLV